MIINDLNYLEVTNEEVVGGSYDYAYVDKYVDIDVDFDKDFDFDVNIDVDKDIDATLDSTVTIDGNFASAEGDATAIGDNGFAELTLNVVVTDDLAEASGLAIAAVD
ncbi:hypothetical protein [Calothrix rhizosoleniae]|uniref:hypothetical protein n=1 Tax=Calothrix rhizosoleniae TaxID=888997 RepID=UPI000B4A39C3|nr:hypothetical protein [Calothrix rhizosoleniae]